jgi:hypothetical protein
MGQDVNAGLNPSASYPCRHGRFQARCAQSTAATGYILAEANSFVGDSFVHAHACGWLGLRGETCEGSHISSMGKLV